MFSQKNTQYYYKLPFFHCLQADQSNKLNALKRKLQEDRKIAYEKRICIENERKENKRCQDRLRYHEKKHKLEKTSTNSESTLTCEKFVLTNILPTDLPNTRSGLKRRSEQNCDEFNSPIKRKKRSQSKRKENLVDKRRSYEREKKKKTTS